MEEFEYSDEELIVKFQNGDKSAYNKLVFRYKDRLYNFIYRFVNDIDKAEDLLQDTFIKLYTHKNSYREIAKFSTWLYTIASNIAKTELRKIRRRRTFSASDLSRDKREFVFIRADDEKLSDQDRESIGKNLQLALDALPQDFKTMIILRDIQELSYEDISKIAALPIGTVKSRINRGRLKLQKLLISKGEKIN